MDLLKKRFNKGEPDNLFYWRDKTGNEVDILTEAAGKLSAIEIKAGETISSDYFRGINYFSGIKKGKLEKLIIYGGKQEQRRSNGIVVQPWNEAL